MLFVVQHVKAFYAGGGRQAGDDVHLSESARLAIAGDDGAALDEVLVDLGVVEAAEDRPDGGDRGGDGLDDSGAALLGAGFVAVAEGRCVGDGSGGREVDVVGKGGGVGLHLACHDVDVRGIIIVVGGGGGGAIYSTPVL